MLPLITTHAEAEKQIITCKMKAAVVLIFFKTSDIFLKSQRINCCKIGLFLILSSPVGMLPKLGYLNMAETMSAASNATIFLFIRNKSMCGCLLLTYMKLTFVTLWSIQDSRKKASHNIQSLQSNSPNENLHKPSLINIPLFFPLPGETYSITVVQCPMVLYYNSIHLRERICQIWQYFIDI